MTPQMAHEKSEIEQCRVWIDCYRARDYTTTLQAKSLTPLRVQHLFEEDIQMVTRNVRWNADYDMVVGDVTPEEVRKIAEEKYGPVPSRELAPRIDEPLPPRRAETRMGAPPTSN